MLEIAASTEYACLVVLSNITMSGYSSTVSSSSSSSSSSCCCCLFVCCRSRSSSGATQLVEAICYKPEGRRFDSR
jgi:hypothetical protein